MYVPYRIFHKLSETKLGETSIEDLDPFSAFLLNSDDFFNLNLYKSTK